ncbi:DUF1289 domain-containing protein [Thauera sp. 63]|jgi:hypothetical protein|uniref:DUF1289 domain-containing protein n=1 Tax=Thauera sp. 63 TaxID=497321 RepID=UPI0002D04E45|nr:DUF1289 domain-containing protein [Thauera sp. 63]ENO75092.1 hypothetical protein C664_18112 [Thauera sp. 63]
MSGDALCVGVCMIDWESGVCLGCGRTADEIYGTTDTPEAAPQAGGAPGDGAPAAESPAADAVAADTPAAGAAPAAEDGD